jgi:acetyl esterase
MSIRSQMQAVLTQLVGFGSPLSPGTSIEQQESLQRQSWLRLPYGIDGETSQNITLPPPAVRSISEAGNTVYHIAIPTCSGGILARIFRPPGMGPFPILILFSQQWVVSNLDLYTPSCHALSRAAGCIVVAVTYRQAPKHRYWAAVEDAYAATQWIIANAHRINGDAACVAVGGERAGGNLALAICLKARDEGGRLPVAQLLICPVRVRHMVRPFYADDTNAESLNAALLPWFWPYNLGDDRLERERYTLPLQEAELEGLPPAIFITSELDSDSLYGEYQAYAQQLSASELSLSGTKESITHEFFGLPGIVGGRTQDILVAASEALKMVWKRDSTPNDRVN